MTREPDRFDKQGEELACAYHTARCPDRSTLARQIAAALRAEQREALERAAQWHEDRAARVERESPSLGSFLSDADRDYIAKRAKADRDDAKELRALTSPAAAPAAEPRDVVTGTARETYAGIDFTLGTTPIAPSLLRRVLAVLDAEYRRRGGDDGGGYVGALAAELRRYIAEMENPHPLSLRARVNAADKRIADMEAAIRWACGETDFVPPEGNPAKYWWRYELYRRSGLKALDEDPEP